MSNSILLIALFLVLALVIPFIVFFRVFRTVSSGLDESAKDKDKAGSQTNSSQSEQSSPK